MNDDAFDDLALWLERSLVSLPLGRARRLEMKEELLAHLHALYEQELARLKDHNAAAASAKQRFGNAETLSKEIHDSIPFWKRLQFLAFHKESVMWRWFLLAGCLAFLFGLGLVCPALARFTQPEGLAHLTPQSAWQSAALLMLGTTIAAAGLGSGAYGALIRL